MKRAVVIWLIMLAAVAEAQTLEQARAWYNEGRYEEAKPVFERLVKSAPSNGNYCLWFGVCCLKTGEADRSIKYLQTAVKKSVSSGRLHLAQAYHAAGRYDEAVSTFDDYIADLARRKRSTDLADSLQRISRLGVRLLKGVEQVVIIDSVVVDKADLLSVYSLSGESGRLFGDVVQQDDTLPVRITVYETELGNRRYFSEPLADGGSRLVTSDKTDDGWSEARPLPGLTETAPGAAYPYVMADGVTLYFAAQGTENSLGGWDIFVTRYSTGQAAYLGAENIGLPFNSPYNDYMFAVDEFNDLGWFASDRFQPEGKVCVYIFVPNETKRVYSYEQTEHETLISLSRINSIADTWPDGTAPEDALQRLAELQTEGPVEQVGKADEFSFVINDRYTYHHTSDFRSSEALQLFLTYRGQQRTRADNAEQLSELRQRYAESDASTRRRLSPTILQMEQDLLSMDRQLARLEVEIRRHENGGE